MNRTKRKEAKGSFPRPIRGLGRRKPTKSITIRERP